MKHPFLFLFLFCFCGFPQFSSFFWFIFVCPEICGPNCGRQFVTPICAINYSLNQGHKFIALLDIHDGAKGPHIVDPIGAIH